MRAMRASGDDGGDIWGKERTVPKSGLERTEPREFVCTGAPPPPLSLSVSGRLAYFLQEIVGSGAQIWPIQAWVTKGGRGIRMELVPTTQFRG